MGMNGGPISEQVTAALRISKDLHDNATADKRRTDGTYTFICVTKT